jgi:glycosyltransferase involved in cell wall biosynthesis
MDGPVTDREFSIIICTFNGAARIERVLIALAQLNGGSAHEIIVVDNCSTDGVAAAASGIWDRIGQPSVDFRVISEPTLGLSAARRAGARAATREIIVFCDDDNLLAPNYLEVAASIMADQTIGAAGGAIAPIIGCEIPPFFFTHATWYAVGAQAIASGEIETLWGAGLVVRRKLLVQLYDTPEFPILMGRRGSALTTGEDHEISHCVSFLGYRLWYDDRLNLKHMVSNERIDEAYIRRLIEGWNTASPVLVRYAELRRVTNETFRQRLRSILSAVARVLLFVRRRDIRFFGLMARFRATFMMTLEERAIVKISRSLQKSRQSAALAPGIRFAARRSRVAFAILGVAKAWPGHNRKDLVPLASGD